MEMKYKFRAMGADGNWKYWTPLECPPPNIDPNTLSAFGNRLDSKGEEIYEGDVIMDEDRRKYTVKAELRGYTENPDFSLKNSCSKFRIVDENTPDKLYIEDLTSENSIKIIREAFELKSHFMVHYSDKGPNKYILYLSKDLYEKLEELDAPGEYLITLPNGFKFFIVREVSNAEHHWGFDPVFFRKVNEVKNIYHGNSYS